jgi:hypothetical protein
MSALGHKRIFRDVRITSALPPITDILVCCKLAANYLAFS